MDIEQLKTKATALSEAERNELIDYLLDLGRKHRGDHMPDRDDEGRSSEPASTGK